jgi:hypothetical protein
LGYVKKEANGNAKRPYIELAAGRKVKRNNGPTDLHL